MIFFSIVMIFGISISSGALNGLVFFSHNMIDIFTQDIDFSSSHFNHASKSLILLQKGHQLIYGLLNLDFFSVYSFCLWKGAKIMDVLAFKYVTNATALALIMLIVVTMNWSLKLRTCTHICSLRVKRKDSSITHGISTFLILLRAVYKSELLYPNQDLSPRQTRGAHHSSDLLQRIPLLWEGAPSICNSSYHSCSCTYWTSAILSHSLSTCPSFFLHSVESVNILS